MDEPRAPADAANSPKQALFRDDLAYLLPMGVFLAFTWAGGQWQRFYIPSYVLKTLFAAVLLALLWRHYTKVRWTYWWLGIVMGVIGVVQWVAMEKGILRLFPNYPRVTVESFNPEHAFAAPWQMWAFIAVRWAGASLVVPVMEELFWRDFLWRSIVAPGDFRLAEVGEWDGGKAFLFVSLLFCTVHIQWMTAIVWGMLVGLLLVVTRSLGACMIMHGVTNFLLGLYVLWTKDWYFW